jgi:hypothetical protein
VSHWREQAVIDAPVEEVWELIGDPNRHPEWWPVAVEVSGLRAVTQDATYRQVSRSARGTIETTFQIDALEELREIKVRCTDFGAYARWLLTEAQDATFADVEVGFESDRTNLGLLRAPLAKRFLRRWAEVSITGLREALSREDDGKQG